jgi:hypothetical protein
VQTTKGANNMLWIEGAKISEEGELVFDDTRYFSQVNPEPAPVVAKPGPSSIASINVKAFMEEMTRRNLTQGGEYGPLGPIIGKLKHLLKGVDDNAAVRTSIGELLSMGDHPKYNMAAAFLAMNSQQIDELSAALDSSDLEKIQEFCEKIIPAIA